MTYLGVFLGVIIMAAMVYLALDKKSTFSTRIAALAALAVMILTVVICLIIYFSDTTVPIDPSMLIVGAPPQTAETEGNSIWVMLLLIVVMVAIFSVIFYLAMKENKKHAQKAVESSVEISKKFDF